LSHVYTDGASSFEVYEDDGESWPYEEGAYALTSVACAADSSGVTLAIERLGEYAMVTQREIDVRIYLPAPPRQVAVNGSALQPEAWSHDGRHFLSLRLRQTVPRLEIAIT
jgi:alpha-glucosidase